MENHFSPAWFTFILLFFRICFFSIFFPHNFFPCVLQNFLSSVSPCLLPWVVLCCAVNLVFLPPWLLFFITSSCGSHPDCARPSEAASLLNWTTGSSSRTSETRSTACSWKWRSSPGSGEERALQPTGWLWVFLRLDSERRGSRDPAISILSLQCPFSDIRTQKASHTSTFPQSCRYSLCSKN